MSGITVRKADPGDMPELLEIRREMLAIVNGVPESGISDEIMRLSEEYFRNGSQTTVLAYCGEKPRRFVSVLLFAVVLRVTSIAVCVHVSSDRISLKQAPCVPQNHGSPVSHKGVCRCPSRPGLCWSRRVSPLPQEGNPPFHAPLPFCGTPCGYIRS